MAKVIYNLKSVLVLTMFPVVFGMSVNIAEYMIKQIDKRWTMNQGTFTVRSLNRCSTQCSQINTICGFNYYKFVDGSGITQRTCQCILQNDLVFSGVHENITGSVVYIGDSCLSMYEIIVSGTTSTSTTSTTSITTTTSTTTTTTTTTPTPTTTTTIPPPTTTTTTTTTQTPTPTTTPILTTTTTTTPTTTTAAPSLCTSTVDALVYADNTIYVFINDVVLTYSTYQALVLGASTTHTLTSLFPQVSHPLDAGYYDGTHIYLIKGSDTWRYTLNPITYDTQLATTSLYSSGDSDDSENSNTNYDAIVRADTETYYITGSSLTIVESGSFVQTVSLNNNGNKNPYKSNNYNSRPSQIDAACDVDSDTHVIISQQDVYTFTFSTKLWTNIGQLICS